MHFSPCWRARLENIGSLLLLLNNYIRGAEERQQGGGASPTSISPSSLPPLPLPPPSSLRSGVFGRQALGLASFASGSRPQGNSCRSVVLPPSMPLCSGASAAGRDLPSSGPKRQHLHGGVKACLSSQQFVKVVEAVSDLDYLLHGETAAPQ